VDENAGFRAEENAEENAAHAAPHGSGGRFQKGNPGYGLRRAAREREEAEERGEGGPPVLKAMRWVTTQPPEKDRTQLQKECREWLRSDRKGFLTKLADLEKAFVVETRRGGQAGDQADGEKVLSEGTARVMELEAERWERVKNALEDNERLRRRVAELEAENAELRRR
jgi:hypothetical protein